MGNACIAGEPVQRLVALHRDTSGPDATKPTSITQLSVMQTTATTTTTTSSNRLVDPIVQTTSVRAYSLPSPSAAEHSGAPTALETLPHDSTLSIHRARYARAIQALRVDVPVALPEPQSSYSTGPEKSCSHEGAERSTPPPAPRTPNPPRFSPQTPPSHPVSTFPIRHDACCRLVDGNEPSLPRRRHWLLTYSASSKLCSYRSHRTSNATSVSPSAPSLLPQRRIDMALMPPLHELEGRSHQDLLSFVRTLYDREQARSAAPSTPSV